ncbi:MAG: inorganic diphosphatase [Pseudomonadota bacterium]|nr:inorganic diphosphatase [Pseudomonadota bacterium]
MNHWHDIPIGDKAPDEFNVIIEVPRYSTIKYTLDQELGLLRVSHGIYPPVPYPGNYGFIPQTLDDDGDPLGMMLVMRAPVSPLTLCRVRPIGVVNMSDEEQSDDKVLCVMLDDPVYAPYERFDALPQYEQEELRWFFKEYQRMMHAEVEVKEIEGVEYARKVIKRCMEKYTEKYASE